MFSRAWLCASRISKARNASIDAGIIPMPLRAAGFISLLVQRNGTKETRSRHAGPSGFPRRLRVPGPVWTGHPWPAKPQIASMRFVPLRVSPPPAQPKGLTDAMRFAHGTTASSMRGFHPPLHAAEERRWRRGSFARMANEGLAVHGCTVQTGPGASKRRGNPEGAACGVCVSLVPFLCTSKEMNPTS